MSTLAAINAATRRPGTRRLRRIARVVGWVVGCSTGCGTAGIAASPPLGAGEGIEILRRDGTRTVVRDIAIVAGAGAAAGATVTALDGGASSGSLEEVVAVDFRPTPYRGEAPALTLRLHDGSRLVGRVTVSTDEEIEFALASGGSARFNLDAIRAVLAGPRHAEFDLARFATMADGDALFRRREVGGDSTRGTVVAIAGEGVKFEYALGVGDFKWEDIEAVLLEEQEPPPPAKGLQVEVDLLPDGTLIGELLRVTATEVVLRRNGESAEWSLPRASVAALRLPSQSRIWLSQQEPIEVLQVPWLGGSDDFLFPWRRDRTVSGRPLVVAGQRFGRGIGCHSRCELAFAVPAGARHFVASVGIADEVLTLPARGAVEFRVLLDGKELWKSGLLRGGEPATRLPPLAILGGKSLRLITDFAADEDIADRAVWGDALLLQ